jgi:hypothetical protein
VQGNLFAELIRIKVKEAEKPAKQLSEVFSLHNHILQEVVSATGDIQEKDLRALPVNK